MDSADWTLLVVVGLILFGSFVHNRRVLRRDAGVVQKYKLYAVRDSLIRLVASKKIREQEFLFQVHYKAINYLIGETKTINLQSFVEAVDRGRRRGLDPGSERLRRKIERACREVRDEEVLAVLRGFNVAMTRILLENSFVVRSLVRYAWLRRVLSLLGKSVSKALRESTQGRAVSYYRDYEACAHAA